MIIKRSVVPSGSMLAQRLREWGYKTDVPGSNPVQSSPVYFQTLSAHTLVQKP